MNQPGNPTPAAAAKRGRASASRAKGRGSVSTAGPGGRGSGRHGKFNAKGERVNGIWMASASQAERYRQLLKLVEEGVIDNLKTEVMHRLMVNNQLICSYRSDFEYDLIDERGNVLDQKIEDVKGMLTPEFEIKHKLFNALEVRPLTLLHVRGKRIHPERPGEGSTGAGWMHYNWAGKLPE